MAVDIATTLLSGVGLPLVAGIICLFILVYILSLCVCGDSGGKSSTGITQGKYRQTPDTAEHSEDQKAKVNSVAIDVDNSLVPLENGQAVTEDLRLSSSSQKSPGHSPHHANQRQLPAPPPNTGNGALGASLTSRASSDQSRSRDSGKNDDSDGEDDYDHLNESRKPNRASNYDHVVLDNDGKVVVKEKRVEIETDYAEVNLENIYTPVKEGNATKIDDYNKVKDTETIRGQGRTNFSSGDDPYASVKDEEKDFKVGSKKEDPYAKVKGDKEDSVTKVKGDKEDPYAKVKGDKEDPYAKAKSDKEDPYTKVKGEKEDPYTKVKEKDDPYNRVKEPGEQGSSDESDPYNKVKDDEDDDPYNSVSEDEMDSDKIDDPYNKIKTDYDPYNKVNDDVRPTESKVKDSYSVVKKTSVKVTTRTSNSVVNGEEKSEFLVEESTDEYAVVMKNRSETPTTTVSNGNSNGAVHSPSVDSDQYQLPPEPPRNYRGEEEAEEAVDDSGPWRIPVTMNTGAVGGQAQDQGTGVVGRKEPPYIKLTSRESMASINARRAQNTYETVVETENMYATVEGGSGDGVVKPPAKVANANTALSRNSQSNDFYAEIGASGGSQTRVPAPPSLDSLHMMTKTHPDTRQGSRSSTEESDLRPLSDQLSSPGAFSNHSEAASSTRHSREVQFSSNFTHSAMENKGDKPIILDPDYQTVQDSVNDLDCDIDPNYESVEEAKAKVGKFEVTDTQKAFAVNPKKRNHVYEEVKPSTSSSDAVETRRVMRSHMYEDIDEVQEQKKELNRKSQELEKKTKSGKKK